MPQVFNATLKWNPTSGLFIRFSTEGQEYTFRGNVSANPALRPFASATANLRYDFVEQLTGQKSFNGSFTPSDLTLLFEDGVTITARIFGQEQLSLIGRGSWDH